MLFRSVCLLAEFDMALGLMVYMIKCFTLNSTAKTLDTVSPYKLIQPKHFGVFNSVKLNHFTFNHYVLDFK